MAMRSNPAASKTKANASPASKAIKHFMSITFSAASKVTSSKKRDRNVCPCPPKSLSLKSPAPKGVKKLTVSASGKAASGKQGISEPKNILPLLPKYAPTKTPPPKCPKNFMSPTVSAASKAVVRVERSEPKSGISKTKEIESPGERMDEENVRPLLPKCASAKNPPPKNAPAKILHQKSCIKTSMSPTISAATSAVAREENSEPKSGISKTEEIESPGERVDVANGKSSREERTVVLPPYNSIKNYLFVQPNTNSSLDIEGMQADGEFSNPEFSELGISSDDTEETIHVLPPYDPIKNYLSPRPDFLRYRPNRDLDIDDTEEVDCGFKKPQVFKFEISPDPREESSTVLPPYDPMKKDTFVSPRPMFLRYRPNRGLDLDVIEEEGFEQHQFLKSEEDEALSAVPNKSKAKDSNGIKGKINVNVLPMAAPPKKGNKLLNSTPANDRTDCLQRTSPFKDLNTPASASAKSPASKGDSMKHFMSPTLSAASKAASSRKRIPVRKCLRL